MTAEEDRQALERILAAWTNPGPELRYHMRAQDFLRANWPTLATALDDASKRRQR